MFVRNQLLFSPEGEQTGGGGETTTVETPKEISLQDAIKAIEKIGGTVYASESAKNNAIKATRGNWESDVRGKVKESFGVGWNDNEPLEDYIKRASGEFVKSQTPEKKKDKSEENEDFKALKSALEAKNQELEQFKSQLSNYEKEKLSTEMQGFVNKGIPLDKLDYDEFTKDGVLIKINNGIKEKYDFQKDEKGWKVINKATGELIPDSEGNRKSIENVVGDYIKSLQGLKFKQEGKAANLPGSSEGTMSEAAKKSALEKADAEIQSKGLLGHERQAVEILKKYGVATQRQMDFLQGKK